MAQQKRKKKKRRSRHDPARREAARRREEARQQAAEERRRQQEAEERRTRLRKRLRRLTVPALATIGVFVLGFFLFRPPPELDEAIQITSPNALMSRLGYDNEWTDLQADDLPQPECGRAAAELSGIETYSAIYNGLITLWYRPTGRIGEAEIWDAVSEIDNHNLNVIVAPNSAIETPVAAASWTAERASRRSAGTCSRCCRTSTTSTGKHAKQNVSRPGVRIPTFPGDRSHGA